MTILLAKVLGMYFLAIGAALLLNPKNYIELTEKLTKDDGYLLLAGIMALFLGAFIVASHNVWTLSWPVMITVIGWISIVKGFTLIAYPKAAGFFTKLFDESGKFSTILQILTMVMGLFLSYQGWSTG